MLRWMNVSLFESVLSTVYSLNSSKDVWSALANQFASHSRSHVAHLKRQLQILKQGPKTCSEFLQTTKLYTNQLVVAGKMIEDDELISYIISGLNLSFNSFITSFSLATRERLLSFNVFRDELLNHKSLLNQQVILPNASDIALMAQRPNSRPFNPEHKPPFNSQNLPRPWSFNHNFKPTAPFSKQKYASSPSN